MMRRPPFALAALLVVGNFAPAQEKKEKDEPAAVHPTAILGFDERAPGPRTSGRRSPTSCSPASRPSPNSTSSTGPT